MIYPNWLNQTQYPAYISIVSFSEFPPAGISEISVSSGENCVATFNNISALPFPLMVAGISPIGTFGENTVATITLQYIS